MAYLFIYLIQLADVILVIGVISCVAALTAGVMYFATMSEDWCKDISKIMKNVLIGSIITAILSGLFPSKQTLLLSGATYYGTKVYKNIVTDEKVSKVNTIINLELEKQIKSLKEELK